MSEQPAPGSRHLPFLPSFLWTFHSPFNCAGTHGTDWGYTAPPVQGSLHACTHSAPGRGALHAALAAHTAASSSGLPAIPPACRYTPTQTVFASCTGPKVTLAYRPKACTLDEGGQVGRRGGAYTSLQAAQLPAQTSPFLWHGMCQQRPNRWQPTLLRLRTGSELVHEAWPLQCQYQRG